MDRIYYKTGYKNQLFEDYKVDIPFCASIDISSDYIFLSNTGNLLIKKGYAWDGPSGTPFDTDSFMRGSLVHDAIYQLIRLRKLNKDIYKDKADRLLQKMCKEDGMWSIRAWWIYKALVKLGGRYVSHRSRKRVIKAPR